MVASSTVAASTLKSTALFNMSFYFCSGKGDINCQTQQGIRAQNKVCQLHAHAGCNLVCQSDAPSHHSLTHQTYLLSGSSHGKDQKNLA